MYIFLKFRTGFFSFFFLSECGITNKENRIVGGRPTIPNRYPWIARLVYDGRFHCGASLINNDYVITAAHCVRKYVLKQTSD